MDNSDTQEEKRALLLLKSIIFNYHGLDEEEENILQKIAISLDAEEELNWALDFISKDYLTAYERARTHLKAVMLNLDKPKRAEYITSTWESNFEKGYITEMEATAMLKLAKDWEVDSELIASFRTLKSS